MSKRGLGRIDRGGDDFTTTPPSGSPATKQGGHATVFIKENNATKAWAIALPPVAFIDGGTDANTMKLQPRQIRPRECSPIAPANATASRPPMAAAYTPFRAR